MAASPRQAKNAATWRNWYKNNKESYNANRKEKRDSDPDFRAKLAEKQKEYRQSKPPHDPDQPRIKKIGGRKFQVFRIGDAATACNRSIQAIRIWEREGKIPKPSVPGGHRYYTHHQIDLLVEFSEVMDEVRYAPEVRAAAIEEKAKEIAAKWTQYPKSDAPPTK
jgi:hypothetical protein